MILSFVETTYKLTIIDGRCLYNKLTGKRYLQLLLHPIRINIQKQQQRQAPHLEEKQLTRRITTKQQRSIFTPGFFLRYTIEGENVIVYIVSLSPQSHRGICQNAGNITYIIQTCSLEELDKKIGEKLQF